MSLVHILHTRKKFNNFDLSHNYQSKVLILLRESNLSVSFYDRELKMMAYNRMQFNSFILWPLIIILRRAGSAENFVKSGSGGELTLFFVL